jgi:putative SOS response-associated peptidase YedK
MITTQPNSFMKKVHNRMPVILDKKSGIDFLKRKPESALEMCTPLSDKVEMNLEIADNILTDKQRDAVNKQ